MKFILADVILTRDVVLNFPFSSSQYLIILKLRDYCYRILSYFIVSSQQQGTLNRKPFTDTLSELRLEI